MRDDFADDSATPAKPGGPIRTGGPIRIEHDMPDEVDATFRTLRRVAVGYFLVFIGAVAAVPILTLVLGWWSEGRLAGGMSPSFAMAAFGLYVFFFVIAVAAATLANAVEGRMLGGGPDHEPPEEGGEP